MSKGLAATGHRVTVVVPTLGSGRREERRGVTVRWARVPRAFAPLALGGFPTLAAMLAQSWAVACDIRGILGEEPIDVVEFPEWFGLGFFYSILKLRIASLPAFAVRFHMSSQMIDLHRGRTTPGRRRRVERSMVYSLERRATMRASLLSAPTGAAAKAMATGFGVDQSKVAVVANPIDLEPFRQACAHVRCSPQHAPVVLYAGRLEYRKGVDVLADAIPAVRARVPDARFWFVGADHPSAPTGGSMRAYLQSSLADSGQLEAVHFVGQVPRERLPRAYNSATVAAVPSRFETFGYACLEGMAARVPVVSTSVGGIPEVIQHGVTGLLCPANDPGALANCLIAALRSEGLRLRLAGAARIRAEQCYDLTVVGSQMADTYRTIA